MAKESLCSDAQLCPTLCDPTDCISPGPSVHEIFQARVLERGAIAFSKVCVLAHSILTSPLDNFCCMLV